MSERAVVSGTPVTTRDRIAYATAARTIYQDYQVSIQVTKGTVTPFTFSSSNEAVATVDADGTITHLADGVVTITIHSPAYNSSFALNLTTRTESVESYIGGTAGSCRKNVEDFIDARLPAAVTPESFKMFSSRAPGAGTYTYNSPWLSGVNLTGVAASNNALFSQFFGTLVSPRHVLFASHWIPATGTVLTFAKADGTLVNRTLVGMQGIAGPRFTFYPDITVGLLDSDVPEGISFLKVLPVDWATYLPDNGVGLDAVIVNQFRELLLYQVNEIEQDYGLEGGKLVSLRYPRNTDRGRLWKLLANGDSGGSMFTLINGEPVLLSVTTTQSATGTSITHSYSAINAAMTSLGGGYQLTPIDLSAFTAFP